MAQGSPAVRKREEKPTCSFGEGRGGKGPRIHCTSRWPEEEKEEGNGGRETWKRRTTGSHHSLLRSTALHKCPVTWGRGWEGALPVPVPASLSARFTAFQTAMLRCFRAQAPGSQTVSDDMENTKSPIIQDGKNYVLMNHHYQVTTNTCLLMHL